MGVAPRLVEAAIAAEGGRWDTIPVLLGSAVPWLWPEYAQVPVGNVLRWLLADAYERLGRADSAAAIYELFTSPPHVLQAQILWNVQMGLVAHSFAHFRLGHLYAELGRAGQATQHLRAFVEAFTQPDPEYAWMVTDARAKMEELARGQ